MLRDSPSAAFFNGSIYVCGGFNFHHSDDVTEWALTSCERYELGHLDSVDAHYSARSGTLLNGLVDEQPMRKTDGDSGGSEMQISWTTTQNASRVRNMHYARWGSAAVVWRDQLFVLGGHVSILGTSRSCSAAVECYNAVTNRWTKQTPMPQKAFMVAASVVEGQIWAAGCLEDRVVESGDQFFRRGHWVAFAFDPLRNCWTDPITVCHGHFFGTAAFCGYKIYVLGGRDDNGQETSAKVACFDISTAKSIPVPDLSVARYDATVVCVNNELHVIGGVEPRSCSSFAEMSHEVLNCDTHTWQPPRRFKWYLCGASATVVMSL